MGRLGRGFGCWFGGFRFWFVGFFGWFVVGFFCGVSGVVGMLLVFFVGWEGFVGV